MMVAERVLAPSSKILEAFSTAPNLRPMERTTPEQRRRSRDASQNVGSPSDILPTDPVFMLRRVGQRANAIRLAGQDDVPRQSSGPSQVNIHHKRSSRHSGRRREPIRKP